MRARSLKPITAECPSVSQQEYHNELIQRILDGSIADKDDLQRAKIELCRKHRLSALPPNSETLSRVDHADLAAVSTILQRKPVRTLSGVAVVAVMTSPAPCPHGKCIFCPGGIENGSPQSYTGKEPAARRGASYRFDPYEQVKGRLEQLKSIGHGTDKVDLIVMGGTFTSRPIEYQETFVKRCFDAFNDQESTSLEEAQLLNETASHRCIGMTIETRPDAMTEEQCTASMRMGMTRVEMGVQVLDDDILRKVNRGHGLQAVIDASRTAKRHGLKICYHMMPGLPGSSPDRDLESFERMFEDPSFRPDMLKIYPTLVVKGTQLYDMWSRGEYSPYTTADAVEVIARMKELVPPYVRIQRIQRDIPVPLIEAGVDKGHLRELVKQRMSDDGKTCHCIRCREVGLMGITHYDDDAVRPNQLTYEASGGWEHFLSFDLPEKEALIGYVRLRTGDGPIAGIRELKVFGKLVPLDQRGDGWQHRGYGRELVARAEERAREEGYSAIRVTSGVGVRRYYASLGYERDGMYMVKQLR
ncbi:MAG: tRNA uridine(34) 5-carboxymethylaminomethyl modification radical SAM/GNAT enzyme Elp3 [Euryarchaeota archaeon]|nr:tRNA uridine(34) 5-carboxymethylaminomethyl modification radical SAM/GNAT enzyme Elp3 [Euryarchaeota archaeon]